MIKTITELASNGLWKSVNSINTFKSNNPSTGDIYYDASKNRNYMFDGINWRELKVSSRNACFNKERMRKINNIFSENQK